MSTSQRGRPRSEQARVAVLDATREFLIEVGFENLSIEAVALRAGVGRQTIYRWWASKAELAADAVLRGGFPGPSEVEIPTSGTIRDDLASWAGRYAELAAEPHNAALIRGLTAAASGNHSTAEDLYERFTGPQRAMLVNRLRLAVERDQICESSDLEVAIDAVLGGILYRIYTQVPLTREHAITLVDIILRGIASNDFGAGSTDT